MCKAGRPIGAANGKQSNTMASCQALPRRPLVWPSIRCTNDPPARIATSTSPEPTKKKEKYVSPNRRTFGDIDVPEPLAQALEKAGFKRPTRIQRNAFPFIKEGTDCVIADRTGTGKTLAYLIPILGAMLPGAAQVPWLSALRRCVCWLHSACFGGPGTDSRCGRGTEDRHWGRYGSATVPESPVFTAQFKGFVWSITGPGGGAAPVSRGTTVPLSRARNKIPRCWGLPSGCPTSRRFGCFF